MAVGNGKLPAWALPIHNLRATRRGNTLASLETLLGIYVRLTRAIAQVEGNSKPLKGSKFNRSHM
jgi:hypothetical protein